MNSLEPENQITLTFVVHLNILRWSLGQGLAPKSCSCHLRAWAMTDPWMAVRHPRDHQWVLSIKLLDSPTEGKSERKLSNHSIADNLTRPTPSQRLGRNRRCLLAEATNSGGLWTQSERVQSNRHLHQHSRPTVRAELPLDANIRIRQRRRQQTPRFHAHADDIRRSRSARAVAVVPATMEAAGSWRAESGRHCRSALERWLDIPRKRTPEKPPSYFQPCLGRARLPRPIASI